MYVCNVHKLHNAGI